jgi:hypothetical protein
MPWAATTPRPAQVRSSLHRGNARREVIYTDQCGAGTMPHTPYGVFWAGQQVVLTFLLLYTTFISFFLFLFCFFFIFSKAQYFQTWFFQSWMVFKFLFYFKN